MLHVLNGDALRPAFEESGIPGEVVVWRDMMSEGPIPHGLASPQDWQARSGWVEQHYGGGSYERVAEDARALVKSFAGHDEVVLWFDEDLFCIANLSFLLARAADDWTAAPRLSLAEGKHTAPETALAPRFAARRALGPREVALATSFWDAYGRDDPTRLAELATSRTPSWPALAAAWRLHLARFPSTTNGLNVLENATLRACANAPLTFHALFLRLLKVEEVTNLGVGDAQVAEALRSLAAPPVPLLVVEGDAGKPLMDERFRGWLVGLTDDGARVLRGAAGADAVRLRGVDRWLGGVHLQGRDAVWRWDEKGKRLARG